MNAEVQAHEIANREYVGVSESDDLVETVELLLEEGADTAVVLRGSQPVGVVTERDVLAMLVEGPDPHEATVGDTMTEQIPTISPTETLEAAADRMSAQSARRLLVTDGSEPMGILTEHDLLTARTHQPERRDEPLVPAGETGTAMATQAETDMEDSFDDQGICEVCGTMTGSLASFNGQLLCADCRDM